MNKEEVLKALDDGHKVRHRFFEHNEWMKKEGVKYVFEDGVYCYPVEFWEFKEHPSWDTDWEIV